MKFDAFLHTNKPTSTELGLEPLTVAYVRDLTGIERGDIPLNTPVDFALVSKFCDQALATDTLLVLDIEHWRHWAKGETGETARLLIIELAEFIRKEYPAVRFGWWGRQGRVTEIQKLVDFVTLALYPHYRTFAEWRENAERQLADRMPTFTNPCYVWLRPEFTKHAGDDLNRKPLPDCYWCRIIQYIEDYPGLAGVFYWGGHKMDWPENGIEL